MKKLIVVLGIFTVIAGSCGRDEYQSRDRYPHNSQNKHSYARGHDFDRNHDRHSSRERDYTPREGRDRGYNGWEYGSY